MARKASRTNSWDRLTSSRGLLTRSHGFTIVELLIVVVVIAILAAITIVAFNGIQDRAKQSAAQAAAKQAGTKIAAFAIQNADTYPADLSAAGLTNGSGTTYQYRVDNAASPRTFCLTATTQNVSYFVSNTASSPTAGGCAGHGLNGLAAVTNYARRPVPSGGNITSWTGYSAAGSVSESAIADAWNGRYAYRRTAGAPGFSAHASSGLEYQGTAIAVPAGASVSPSIHVRSNKAGNYRLSVTFYSGTTFVSDLTATMTAVPVAANTWVRLITGEPVVVPPPADRMTIRAVYLNGTTWVAGDWIDVTGVSTAAGAYADGSSPGWIWNGTPDYSSSTGPPL